MKFIVFSLYIFCLISCKPQYPTNDDLAIQFAIFSIFKDVNFHPIILSGENFITATNEFHYLTFDTSGYTKIELKKEDLSKVIAILPIPKLKYIEESKLFESQPKHHCNFIINAFYKDEKNHYLINIIVGTKKSGFWVEYKLSYEKGLFMILEENGGVS